MKKIKEEVETKATAIWISGKYLRDFFSSFIGNSNGVGIICFLVLVLFFFSMFFERYIYSTMYSVVDLLCMHRTLCEDDVHPCNRVPY